MTDAPQEVISKEEKTAKVIRYDGQLPNEFLQKAKEDGVASKDKLQAVFNVPGIGSILMESGDGEHWTAIAILEEDKGEDDSG